MNKKEDHRLRYIRKQRNERKRWNKIGLRRFVAEQRQADVEAEHDQSRRTTTVFLTILAIAVILFTVMAVKSYGGR